MDEMSKHGRLGMAALRAGMHRNTARRYSALGKLPSELKEPRSWRTREDPFAADWTEIAERLEAAPELEAKVLFEDLVRRYPERYEEGQLRTLQPGFHRTSSICTLAETSPVAIVMKPTSKSGLDRISPKSIFEPPEVDLRWGGTAQLNAVSQVDLIAPISGARRPYIRCQAAVCA